ncbi:hypothetical protein [Streptomyces sp. NRRL S-241]|uniref:hypothetical protein n=1 Tax=Streptomyces sp. NRRL S-241 TaxID=1463896 RepID=UPI0004C21B88|nr:hypothetical protein [Streptomyces sp. NRRL S-241]
MYVMKPLTTTDTRAVDGLIDSRMEFQIAHGHRSGREGNGLRDVVTGAGPDDGRKAVGMWEDENLLAAFVLQRAAPQHGWTIEEREQPTLLVSHAHSLPRQSLLGRLAALWLSDYAARQQQQPLVRCMVREQALAWRLKRTCGWRHVREIRDGLGALHLLQRFPERSQRLEVVVSSDGMHEVGPDGEPWRLSDSPATVHSPLALPRHAESHTMSYRMRVTDEHAGPES